MLKGRAALSAPIHIGDIYRQMSLLWNNNKNRERFDILDFSIEWSRKCTSKELIFDS